MLIIETRRNELASYTLVETLFVLAITLGMFIFPVFSVSAWQEQMTDQHFFSQFEKRIYAAQKTAIVNQQATAILYDQEKNRIIFDIPNTEISWSSLKVPPEIEVISSPRITFAAQTGNESSLKAYRFYWKKKKQTIIYQFQMGSGHYIKKIE